VRRHRVLRADLDSPEGGAAETRPEPERNLSERGASLAQVPLGGMLRRVWNRWKRTLRDSAVRHDEGDALAEQVAENGIALRVEESAASEVLLGDGPVGDNVEGDAIEPGGWRAPVAVDEALEPDHLVAAEGPSPDHADVLGVGGQAIVHVL